MDVIDKTNIVSISTIGKNKNSWNSGEGYLLCCLGVVGSHWLKYNSLSNANIKARTCADHENKNKPKNQNQNKQKINKQTKKKQQHKNTEINNTKTNKQKKKNTQYKQYKHKTDTQKTNTKQTNTKQNTNEEFGVFSLIIHRPKGNPCIWQICTCSSLWFSSLNFQIICNNLEQIAAMFTNHCCVYVAIIWKIYTFT